MSRTSQPYIGSPLRKVMRAEGQSQRSVEFRIRALEDRIAECKRYYPWPALIESLTEDIEHLKGMLTK